MKRSGGTTSSDTNLAFKKIKNQRKWTEDEKMLILNYLREIVLSGKSFEVRKTN